MASLTQPLPKPVIKSTSLAPDMCAKAVSCSLKAIQSNNSDRDIAKCLRKDFQEKYSESTWHCFVGRDIGCHVTHKEGYFIYLYVGQLGICLFAT